MATAIENIVHFHDNREFISLELIENGILLTSPNEAPRFETQARKMLVAIPGVKDIVSWVDKNQQGERKFQIILHPGVESKTVAAQLVCKLAHDKKIIATEAEAAYSGLGLTPIQAPAEKNWHR